MVHVWALVTANNNQDSEGIILSIHDRVPESESSYVVYVFDGRKLSGPSFGAFFW